MGLLDLLFGNNKHEESQLNKETSNKVVQRGYVTTTRVYVSSKNYEELLHRFVAFDTETTGLSPEKDVIIEVGAVKYIEGKIDNLYESLINEGRSVSEEAYKVNHISTDMLRREGKSPDMVYRELTIFLKAVFAHVC